MPSQLIETREKVAAKRTEIRAIFDAHPDLDLKAEDVKDVQTKNKELDELAVTLEGLEDLDRIDRQTKEAADADERARRKAPRLPTGDDAHANDQERERAATKSIGDLFVESEAFKSYDKVQKKGPTAEIDLEASFGRFVATYGVKAAIELSESVQFKATLDTLTGYAPQAVRLPTIITPGEQGPTVASLLPSGNTSANAIPYMEETTAVNAAAETAEGDAKPEATLAFTEKSSAVKKIAVFLPVTDELFGDVPAMRSYVENRLRSFVIQREDGQLLNGNGAGANLRGILNTVGIQTQAKGADPVPDAVYKAVTKIGVNAFLDASGVVMHHNDWQDVRLLRTVDGIYIWGSPADPGPNRIWGLPVVLTTRIAEGTALVGAFRDAAQIFRRSEIAFAVSDSHSDFFQKNLLALRVEERLALVVFRPLAFCTDTGI